MKESFKIPRRVFDEVMVPNYAPVSSVPTRGQGSLVWDQEGRELVDFAGGIAVNCLGHCHPLVVEALQEQSQRLWHVSNVMTNEPALQLASTLIHHTFAEKVFFASSGAEANEAALKLGRRYAVDHFGEQKYEIIAFHRGFHGRTFFTVSAGGQKSYSEGFGPRPKGITHLPFNDIKSLADAMSSKTCAVLVEPIQGEGGVIPASPEFLQSIRQLCDQHKALMIMDEVQTGVGRTGALYAYMNYGVVPDILTTAKSLGAGFPIGAMLTRSDIALSLKVGTHGSTYGGNPLACAVANAVLNEVTQPSVLAAVRENSDYLKMKLAELNQTYKVFDDIRGQGMLIGAELSAMYKGCAKIMMKLALEEGLMVLVAGADVLRFTPSLLIDQSMIDQGLQRLERAFVAFLKHR